MYRVEPCPNTPNTEHSWRIDGDCESQSFTQVICGHCRKVRDIPESIDDWEAKK